MSDITEERKPGGDLVNTLTRVGSGVAGAIALGVAVSIAVPAFPLAAVMAAAVGGSLALIDPTPHSR